ncbi:hypothetical protein [Marinicella rhabdoformis]|uniref:hypothetical protein n=1 Tax=Marinicella rhabdoformis TaxID=2580566 RepID=UPI0012AEC41E|nr:hypothetical protein [Marinicella rhabdoformis]
MKEKILELPNNREEIVIIVRKLGVSIIGYWEIAIEKEDIVEYLNSYNSSPFVGFMEVGDKVILSHKDGKITFTRAEASAIINLIRESYSI